MAIYFFSGIDRRGDKNLQIYTATEQNRKDSDIEEERARESERKVHWKSTHKPANDSVGRASFKTI